MYRLYKFGILLNFYNLHPISGKFLKTSTTKVTELYQVIFTKMHGSCPFECCVNSGYDCVRELLLSVCAILQNGILVKYKNINYFDLDALLQTN